MGRYPEVKEALPATCATKSRTAILLTPTLVTGTVGALTTASIVGTAVASISFTLDAVKTNGIGPAQGLVLLACVFSILYVGLHFKAAIDNEPIGVVRPPVIKIHGMCFVAARISALLWIIAMISSCVVITKPSVCVVATRACKLQAVSVFISTSALFITGIILTSLEACQQPFEVPEFLHRRIKRRASTNIDDVEAYQRSVSQTSLYHDENGDMTRSPEESKELVKPEASISTTVSGESADRRMTPLLPILPKRTGSRGWGDEWTHSTLEKKLIMKHSDSAISMSMSDSSCRSLQSSPAYAISSSGYVRSSTVSGYASSSDRGPNSRRLSQRPYPPRSITRSSSISTLARRSPLSTIRSADRPEIAVRPSLRYTPPLIPPLHEWSSSRAASIARLLPVAEIHNHQRQSTSTEQGVPHRIRKELPPIPGSLPHKGRRSAVGFSRTIVGDDLRSYHERELEDHLRKIEASIAQSQSQRQLANSAITRAQTERLQKAAPMRAKNLNDPVPPLPATTVLKTEPFIQQPVSTKPLSVHTVHRSHSSPFARHQQSERFEDTLEINLVKVQPLRRLSLGDLPIGIDWGVFGGN